MLSTNLSTAKFSLLKEIKEDTSGLDLRQLILKLASNYELAYSRKIQLACAIGSDREVSELLTTLLHRSDVFISVARMAILDSDSIRSIDNNEYTDTGDSFSYAHARRFILQWCNQEDLSQQQHIAESYLKEEWYSFKKLLENFISSKEFAIAPF